MRLDSILVPAPTITEEDAKNIIAKYNANEYQLLDVRLHEEYEDEHLPGAILVPLQELTSNQHTLNPDKPTIVYCRTGRRSWVAAQSLIGQGFQEVYDLTRNIMDWMGGKGSGEYNLNRVYISTG